MSKPCFKLNFPFNSLFLFVWALLLLLFCLPSFLDSIRRLDLINHISIQGRSFQGPSQRQSPPRCTSTCIATNRTVPYAVYTIFSREISENAFYLSRRKSVLVLHELTQTNPSFPHSSNCNAPLPYHRFPSSPSCAILPLSCLGKACNRI